MASRKRTLKDSKSDVYRNICLLKHVIFEFTLTSDLTECARSGVSFKMIVADATD